MKNCNRNCMNCKKASFRCKNLGYPFGINSIQFNDFIELLRIKRKNLFHKKIKEIN